MEREEASSIEIEYRRRTRNSAELMARAARSLPGGNTRTHGHYDPYPLAFAHAKGPFIWDVDGNRYVDLENNGTSLIHGHAFEPVVRTIRATVEGGSGWTGSSKAQVVLAELLCERMPSFELVRFCNSGTEAGIMAAKVSRRATGRPLLLKSWFGYHGSYDDLEAGLHGKGEIENRTLLAEFGNAKSFEEVLAESGDRIAAVVLEPVLVTGVIKPPEDFLPRVRAATTRVGAVLVLDECVMFRLSEGGAQQKMNVQPDLTMLSKSIGGGLPMGALGGTASIMDLFDPASDDFVYHGGTFNGNVLAAAAGSVAVQEFTAERIAQMDRHAEELDRELCRMAAVHGLPMTVNREGSLLALYFLAETPNGYSRDRQWDNGLFESRDLTLLRAFHLACLNHGIFVAPAREIVLSTAVSEDVLAEVIERMGKAMGDVAADATSSEGVRGKERARR